MIVCNEIKLFSQSIDMIDNEIGFQMKVEMCYELENHHFSCIIF